MDFKASNVEEDKESDGKDETLARINYEKMQSIDLTSEKLV